ncbi:MAG: hypothetical protein HKP27_03605 [Myxococcales bacterium]|nr:hypothetical protein [Myxococcales bacterium]
MKGFISSFTGALRALHKDESGDVPVGPILLVGLIVIPLVIFLLAFGEEIQTWFSDNFQTLTSDKGKIKTAP